MASGVEALGLRYLSAGQAELEARSPAGFGFHPHIPAVLEDGLARQSETESEAVAFAGADKRLEEGRADFGRDAGSVVLDLNDRGPLFETGGDVDGAAIRHGLEGVADEVDKGAFHTAALQRQLDFRRNREADADSLGLG